MKMKVDYIAIPKDAVRTDGRTLFVNGFDGIEAELYELCRYMEMEVEKNEFIKFVNLHNLNNGDFYYDFNKFCLYGDLNNEKGVFIVANEYQQFMKALLSEREGKFSVLKSFLGVPMFLNNYDDEKFSAEIATKAEHEQILKSDFSQVIKNNRIYYPEMSSQQFTDDVVSPFMILPAELRQLNIIKARTSKSSVSVIPVIKMSKHLSPVDMIFTLWNNYGLFPELGLSLINNIEEFRRYFFNKKLLKKDDNGFLRVNNTNLNPTIATPKDIQNIKTYYKNIDSGRIGSAEYSDTVFDAKHGHWALYRFVDMTEKSCFNTANLRWYNVSRENIFAKNPIEFVDPSPVAVDVGTTSTVAAIMNFDRDVKYLTLDGKQNENYENPTVIMYKDISSFEESYKKEQSLPRTNKEDILTAHPAQEEYTEYKENVKDSMFFDRLKQWASDPECVVEIVDAKEELRTYKDYMNFNDTIIDPIEIYAYHLGLYINNLQKEKIFTTYHLSYTSTFTKEVRERMVRSFERGIKKTLPNEILDLNILTVKSVLDEATAYAYAAIERYIDDSWKEELEKGALHFGIYDFGGGTLDFSFGKYSIQEDEDGDERPHFEFFDINGGDSKLGCEYILEKAAYELFYTARDFLHENGVRCKKPHHCSTRSYEDKVAGTSDHARRNLRFVMDELRKKWIDPDFNIEIPTIKNEKGSDFIWKNFLEIYEFVDVETNFFEEKVHEGVDLFFKVWDSLFLNEKLYIFLGGNAGRSVRVQKAFDELRKPDDLRKDSKETKTIEVYPALPTEYDIDEIEKGNPHGYPSAKTGVVYGILRQRDIPIVEPSWFVYNVGYPLHKADGSCYFVTCASKRDMPKEYRLFESKIFKKPKINKNGTILIRYSQENRFATYLEKNKLMSVNGSKPLKELTFPEHSGKFLYIRGVTSDTIELGVSESDSSSIDEITTIVRCNLRKGECNSEILVASASE